MAPQVGVKYAIPRPLGGVLRSLETLAAASGTLDCVPIDRPDICIGVSLASVHAPGLSCRHVTKSAHRASGYQQAAICYSWCSGGAGFSRAEPAAKTHYVPRQQSNDQNSNLCNTRSSQRDTQLVLHRAVVISHQRGQESCH